MRTMFLALVLSAMAMITPAHANTPTNPSPAIKNLTLPERIKVLKELSADTHKGIVGLEKKQNQLNNPEKIAILQLMAATLTVLADEVEELTAMMKKLGRKAKLEHWKDLEQSAKSIKAAALISNKLLKATGQELKKVPTPPAPVLPPKPTKPGQDA